MVDGTVLQEGGEVTAVDAEAVRREASEVGLGMDLTEERQSAQRHKP
jgi:hypothetical protein